VNLISPRWSFSKWKETHSYHREDDADGAEDGLGWRDAREIFGDSVEALDDDIQRGEDIVSTFRLLGFCIHGF